MTKINKKTRIKGLPAKLQLNQQDATTGSYPTKVKIASDNRTGKTPLRFDDTTTQTFSLEAVYYPSLMPTSSVDLSTELTSSISASALPRKGVEDQYIRFTVSGAQNLQPFRDNNNPAVDGKTSGNPFYATGSKATDAGEGFSNPLWSKTKIEIPIEVVSATTLSLATGSVGQLDTSYPMGYYNFSTKQWDKIWNGKGINAYSDGNDAVRNLTIGFGNTLLPAGQELISVGSMGYTIGDLGFPFGYRYSASSGQKYNLSSVISSPFVLEKMVLKISGEWEIGDVNLTLLDIGSSQRVTCSVNTVFLLNERSNQRFVLSKSINDIGIGGGAISLSERSPSGSNASARDIISSAQIFSFSSGSYSKILKQASPEVTSSVDKLIKFSPNDTVITSSISGISGANWNKTLVISMSVNEPVGTSSPIIQLIPRFVNGSDFSDLLLGNNKGRNGLGLQLLSGRSLIGAGLFSSGVTRTLSVSGVEIIEPIGKTKISPYVLLPTDNLILGWQIPISENPAQHIVNSHESKFIFHTGSFSLTLYGSQISEGKERHDTLNQETTSNVVHEVIG